MTTPLATPLQPPDKRGVLNYSLVCIALVSSQVFSQVSFFFILIFLFEHYENMPCFSLDICIFNSDVWFCLPLRAARTQSGLQYYRAPAGGSKPLLSDVFFAKPAQYCTVLSNMHI